MFIYNNLLELRIVIFDGFILLGDNYINSRYYLNL